MIKWFSVLCLLAGTPLYIFAQSQTKIPAISFTYRIDPAAIREIGQDLYGTLKDADRVHFSPNPLWVKQDARFYTSPFRFESKKFPTRVVYVSQGLLSLANTVAHAKAIEKIEPGFFAKFISNLGNKTNSIQMELPVMSDPRHWNEDVMNEQAGYFNQIVGVITAVNLAHHYLGHYEKYGKRLRDSALDPTTMAELCSTEEWRAALQRGAANALECGFGFEGIKAFYEGMETMEAPAPWKVYFLPANANVTKIKEDLDGIENRFFRGGEKR